MREPRILHIIHGLTVGGAEVDLLRKSIALVQNYDYTITICCLMRRGELAEHAERAGIRVVGPLMRHRYDVLAGRQLRRLLIMEPWSLVHTHLFAANFVGCAVAMTLSRKCRPLLVASEHAMAERWSGLVLLIDRWLQRYTTCILVPSEAAAASYAARGLEAQRIQVMPNGLDVERFTQIDLNVARTQKRQELDIPPRTYLIGTVCRLQAVKGLPVLLQAIETLPVHLIIAGDGPVRPVLESIIQQRELAGRVQLLGTRSDVPQILATCDLFVLPSYSESFGIAVAEALLAKTPVVATEVGGIPEITVGAKYARLIAPGDANALKNGIQWMMDHPDKAQIQAQRGHEFVVNSLSVGTVTDRLHTFYQQLLTPQAPDNVR